MTLNLMLTSRDAVYLSADFRLMSLKDSTPLPDSFHGQKLIPVVRHRWAALVAFMGVASAPPLVHDMGRWILEQIDEIPADSDHSDLSDRLLRLNQYLGRMRGDRRIAFSIVGFQERQPFMMLLSNFVDLDGHLTEPGPQLTGDVRAPTRHEVRAVGTLRPDVFERVRLQRMLQANASRGPVPELIRKAIAEVNGAVARRSRGMISEACVSGYLLRSGAAAIGGHGLPDDAACLPDWVRRDLRRGGVVGFAPVDQGNAAAPVQWLGMTTRFLNGRVIRAHEIANAGRPVFDGREHERGPASWTFVGRSGQNTLSIAFRDVPR